MGGDRLAMNFPVCFPPFFILVPGICSSNEVFRVFLFFLPVSHIRGSCLLHSQAKLPVAEKKNFLSQAWLSGV
jgi:hypothetical protein